MESYTSIYELITGHKLIASALLIAILLVARWLIVRTLKLWPADDSLFAKRLSNGIKNVINLLIVIGLIIIWLSELRFVALSVAAFAVAIVIATREFIQCFLGYFYLAGSGIFRVGDWIKVGTHVGEVVESDWLNTTLLEVDIENASYAYTGKNLVIPNNQFVANTVVNLNFMRRYVAHSFTIVREEEHVDLCGLTNHVLERANEYCSGFKEVATRYNGLIEQRLGIDTFCPEPTVRVTTTSLGRNAITVTVFCPTREAITIEQNITKDFMAYWYDAKRAAKDR